VIFVSRVENGAFNRSGEEPAGWKDQYPICTECSRRKEPSGEFEFKSLKEAARKAFNDEKGSGLRCRSLSFI
jgi:hypothetical protein